MLLVLACSGACLPEGDPPAGTRLLEERHLVNVRALPAPGDSVLFSRRAGYRDRGDSTAFPIFDLWSIPSRGGSPVRLVEDVDWYRFPGLPAADARGRLVVAHHESQTAGPVSYELTLADPAGERVALGRITDVSLSPGLTRLSYEKQDGTRVVREADGRETPLGPSRAFDTRFAGETLVFNQDDDLWALRPDATQPVLLVPRFRGWTARSTSSEVQIAAFSQPVEAMRGDPPKPMSLLLIRGASSRVLMTGYFASSVLFAPGDDRIVVVEQLEGSGSLRLRVFHADGEGQETIDLAATAPGEAFRFQPATVTFRPGTREIWCFLGDGLRIVRDDGSLLSLPPVEHWPFVDPTAAVDIQPEKTFFPQGTSPPLFTSDGRFWLYRFHSSLFLARADQPQLPGLVIQERNDFPVAHVREVGDGRRLLVWSAPPGNGSRWDLTLLDSETNERRLLATALGPSAVGKRRVLAITNLLGGLGDLRLIDLDTGQDSLLAQNVTGFALPAPCAGCDPTAPGAPVAYVVHARIPFKYDGLWRLELP